MAFCVVEFSHMFQVLQSIFLICSEGVSDLIEIFLSVSCLMVPELICFVVLFSVFHHGLNKLSGRAILRVICGDVG